MPRGIVVLWKLGNASKLNIEGREKLSHPLSFSMLSLEGNIMRVVNKLNKSLPEGVPALVLALKASHVYVAHLGNSKLFPQIIKTN